MVKKAKCRGPSLAIAKTVLKRRQQKHRLRHRYEEVEEQFRKNGGFGRPVVSIWEAPAGGIENSPAYRRLLTRCEVDAEGKPPRPEDRDGAPVKGGFPIKKYPPNVLVDCVRAPWLPDDWAQVLKNTGPGGVYFGWMSPEGKFFYHRNGYPSSIEGTLGRKLSPLDGLNGVKRMASRIVKPGADKKFLRDCLTAKELKSVAPAIDFLFAVVSGRRATSDSGGHDIMVVEGLFRKAGVTPVWYVDAESLSDYRKLGLNAKVGGKLTPARNMALNDAKKQKKVCVQISDDISRWTYYDCDKQDFRGETDFTKANKALLGTKKHIISPLAAAQFILAKMRSDDGKPHLGGVFPTGNATLTLGTEEFGRHNFILGDFFVAEYSSPCRFDETMSLKEDYDFTCSHLKEHGCVLRCNRMIITVKHSTNAGGAVAARDAQGEKEKMNIAILERKWPCVFRVNFRRKAVAGTEITMNWKRYGQKARGLAKGTFLMKVKNTKIKTKKGNSKLFALSEKYCPTAVLHYTRSYTANYLDERSSKCNGRTIGDCFGMQYWDAKGNAKTYGCADLNYDIKTGRLKISGPKHTKI